MAQFFEGISKRHVVIHMDINRTIIQIDPPAGKGVREVLNCNLCSTVLGRLVPQTATWRPVRKLNFPFDLSQIPSTVPEPTSSSMDSLVTFDDVIDDVLLPCKPEDLADLDERAASEKWLQVSTKRRAIRNAFTEPGHPGEEFRPLFAAMQEALQKPDGSQWTVIPSFFAVVNALSVANWSFTLLFRTFGVDLPNILEEWVRFVMGAHSVLPQGRPLELLRQHYATFCAEGERAPNWRTCVPMATLLRNDSGVYFHWNPDAPPDPTTAAPVSHEQLLHSLWQAGGSAAHLPVHVAGVRDYYKHWAAHAESQFAGKVMPVSLPSSSAPSSSSPHGTSGSQGEEGESSSVPLLYQCFFDDNIYIDEKHRSIVDVRAPLNSSAPSASHIAGSWGEPVTDPAELHSVLCRVEPLCAILQQDYFVKQLEQRMREQLAATQGKD